MPCPGHSLWKVGSYPSTEMHSSRCILQPRLTGPDFICITITPRAPPQISSSSRHADRKDLNNHYSPSVPALCKSPRRHLVPVFACPLTLVCSYGWVHRRTSLMNLSLYHQQYPVCLVLLGWFVRLEVSGGTVPLIGLVQNSMQYPYELHIYLFVRVIC